MSVGKSLYLRSLVAELPLNVSSTDNTVVFSIDSNLIWSNLSLDLAANASGANIIADGTAPNMTLRAIQGANDVTVTTIGDNIVVSANTSSGTVTLSPGEQLDSEPGFNLIIEGNGPNLVICNLVTESAGSMSIESYDNTAVFLANPGYAAVNCAPSTLTFSLAPNTIYWLASNLVTDNFFAAQWLAGTSDVAGNVFTTNVANAGQMSARRLEMDATWTLVVPSATLPNVTSDHCVTCLLATTDTYFVPSILSAYYKYQIVGAQSFVMATGGANMLPAESGDGLLVMTDHHQAYRTNYLFGLRHNFPSNLALATYNTNIDANYMPYTKVMGGVYIRANPFGTYHDTWFL